MAERGLNRARQTGRRSPNMDRDKAISQAFADHYAATIRAHGPTAQGVDMARDDVAVLGYRKMLAVIRDRHRNTRPSLLDVGCGYGGLLAFATQQGYELDYTGVDIVPDMIEHARRLNPGAYILGDALDHDFGRRFDYVVCGGSILTIKLKASILDMNRFSARLIRRMFDIADVGIAFEMMTNQVNFMAENSYYRSPVEVMAFCLSELSSKVIVDHAYERYAFTTYVFRETAI
jgi:SAM-dependent methyltransferase